VKTKTFIVAFAVVAVLAVSAVSFAGPGNGPGRGARGGCGGCGGYGFGPAVDLTEEQQAALRTAYDDYAKKTAAAGQDLYAKNLELEAELAKSAPDAKRVASLTKEVNELNGVIFAERVAFRAKLAKDFGIRGGAGCGSGFGPGYGMMGGGHGQGYGMMGRGFGPGNCPAWAAPEADAKDN